MPFYQQKKNRQFQPGTTGTSGGGMGLSAPAPQGAGKSGGSGWVNLQTYLGLNQEQGANAAGAVAGMVDKKGQAAKAGVEGMQKGFADSIMGDEQKQQDLTYGSMAEMGNYGQVASQADKAAQQAKGLTSFKGRQQSVNEAFGKDTQDYSGGMGRYDNFLTGAAGGERFKQVADAYGGLSQMLGTANEESAAYGKAYKDDYANWEEANRQGQQAFDEGAVSQEQLTAAFNKMNEMAKSGWNTAPPDSDAYKQWKTAKDAYDAMQARAKATYQKTNFQSRANADTRAKQTSIIS